MSKALAGLIFLLIYASCARKPLLDPGPTTDLSVDSTFFYGYWSGEFSYDAYQLPVGFNIGPKKVTFDNPAQGRLEMPIDSFRFRDDSLDLFVSYLVFKLTPQSEKIINVVLEDREHLRTFELFREQKIPELKRPQTPKVTNEYSNEEVVFTNKVADIELSGTLSKPLSPLSSLAILLTGSGPQDRDETIIKHKSFAYIADQLTRAGMGVLRYDDRGVGKSEGIHSAATSFDFAQDAQAAFAFIKTRHPEIKIGFIGHSEGGMIAQIADSLVGGADFHIYLAGPGIDIVDLMIEQNKLVLGSLMSPEGVEVYTSGLRPILNTFSGEESLNDKQSKLNSMTKELYNSLDKEDAKKIAPSDIAFSMSYAQLLYLKWWPYFLSYKPQQYLAQIKCPILALNGSEDIQVTPINLDAIQKIATNSSVTIVEVEGANHLFQICQSCTVGEYGMLTETFTPIAMESILTWLKNRRLLKN